MPKFDGSMTSLAVFYVRDQLGQQAMLFGMNRLLILTLVKKSILVLFPTLSGGGCHPLPPKTSTWGLVPPTMVRRRYLRVQEW